MKKNLSANQFGIIRNLINHQNELINKLSDYSNKVTEPQLRESFQKFAASAKNHKHKLLNALEVSNEQKS